MALLSIFPREIKTCVHTKSCAWFFVAALFVISLNWKKLKCLSIVECFSKVYLFYRILPSNKKVELLIYETTWRDLKIIMPYLKSQTQRSHNMWFHLYTHVCVNSQIHSCSRKALSGHNPCFTHEPDLGNRRLLIPSSVFGMFDLPTIPVLGATSRMQPLLLRLCGLNTWLSPLRAPF